MAVNVTANKNDLMDACYLTFGARRSSGAVLRGYMDPYGYPTIGAGHLIFKPNMSEEELQKYRERHISRMKGIGINPEQAGRDFDALVSACKNGTLKTQMIDGVPVITEPKITPLTTAQAEKLFRRDQERAYSNALKYFPDLHTYPVEVQTCLVHLGSHGSGIDKIYNRCKGDFSLQNIVSTAAEVRLSEDPDQISSNAACEIYYACQAAGIEPPERILRIKAEKASTFETYEKNILTPVREKWGGGSIEDVMLADRQRAMEMLTQTREALQIQVENTFQNEIRYQSDTTQLAPRSVPDIVDTGRNSGR